MTDRAPFPGAARAALVGAGYIAAFHAEVLRDLPGVELALVHDANLRRAERFAAAHGIPAATSDLDELPRRGVTLAHALVPPDRHAEVARALLERGIGVLVEKPLALSSAEARELAALARERSLPLGVNHNSLHHPAFAALLARVRRGEIGRLEHVRVHLSVPLRQLDAGDLSHWMFREPRNIVLEQAVHPFAQVLELLGPLECMDASVLSTRELAPGRPFPERWAIAAVCRRGTAEIGLAFGRPFARSTLEAIGTDGAIEADLLRGTVAGERKTAWLDAWDAFLAGWRRGGETRRGAARGFLSYARQTLGLGRREDAFYASMRASIADFHRAVRSGARPRSGGDQGVEVLRWCEAAVPRLPRPEPEPPLPAVAPPPRPGEVVVLGAAGYVGRRVVRRLLDEGLPVTAAVRRPEALPRELGDAAREGRLRVVRADLADERSLAEAARGARAFVHLATGGGDTWEDVERAMVRGTARLAETCLEEGVERLVYVSSIAALYLGRDQGLDVVDDDVPADPFPERRALYARGKAAAERELLRLHREKGLPVSIARPGVVLGGGAPVQHSGLGLWVRDNHCVGWGRGERPVPLVLVDDVADALVRLVRHEGADLDGRALNLAARTPLRAPDVVAAWRAASGRDAHFHPRALWLSQSMEAGKWLVKRAGGRRDAFPSYRDLKSRELWPALSCERARRILGWRPVEEPRELLARIVGR